MLIKSKVSNSRTLCFLRGLKLKWPFFVYSLLFFITQICHTSFFDRLRGGDEKKNEDMFTHEIQWARKIKVWCDDVLSTAVCTSNDSLNYFLSFRFHAHAEEERKERAFCLYSSYSRRTNSFVFFSVSQRSNQQSLNEQHCVFVQRIRPFRFYVHSLSRVSYERIWKSNDADYDNNLFKVKFRESKKKPTRLCT